MATEKEFKPKYVARVSIGKDKYRYFYTKDEYEAYLKGNDKNAEKESTKTTSKNSLFSSLTNKLKKVASDISNTVKSVSNNISNAVKRGVESVDKALKKTGETPVKKLTSDANAKTGEKVVDTYFKNTNVTTEKMTNVIPTVTSQNIEIGKSSVEKSMEKLSDESIDSVATGSVAGIGMTVAVNLIAGLAALAVGALIGLAKKAISTITKKQEEKKAEQERRDKLSDTYEEFLDSEAPKSFDELQIKEDNERSPYSWNGVADDMADINENYAEAVSLTPPDWSATENCSYCTAAYDLRARGYDVEAGPYEPTDDPTTIEEIMSWYDNPQGYQNTYNPYSYSSISQAATTVEKELLAQGNGARGHFCLYWNGGGGHDVVYEVRNNQVYLLDCQNNAAYNLIDYMQYANQVVYFRTDNIEPNKKILSKIRNDDD